MSTNIDLLNPDLNSVNSLVVGLGVSRDVPKQELLTENELDDLINSQLAKQEVFITPLVQPAPQVSYVQESEQEFISVPEDIQKITDLPPPQIDDTINTNGSDEEEEEEPEPPKVELFDYDLNTMNSNLDLIRTETLERLEKLKTNQNLLYNKTELLEKFNLIDERELAIQTMKKDQNIQRIGQIQNALSRRFELITTVLDVALKYEDTILKWYKTLMEVEKDKVAAYGKIKALSKSASVGESDINKALEEVNKALAGDSKHLVEQAKHELNVSGYSGKKFNQ